MTVAAVCDVSKTAAKTLASGLGVPAFTSLGTLIASGLCDAVHILTPPQLHRDLAVQVLEGGLHAFVEKPFALSKRGARIKVQPGSLMAFYLTDGVKYALKRYALGKDGAVRASLRDWKSRAHFSPFRNDHPKAVLGWTPEKDRDAFIERAITGANLFGF